MTAHTILLIQPTNDSSTRTYYDFDTVALAMDKIASLFEERLLEENPRLTELQYRAEDLLRFIDSHREFVALVFENGSRTYQPHDQIWVKNKLISHLTNKQRSSSSSSSSGRGRGSRRY
ncbi:enhancer of rudimentary [Halteromyces radiatus]|uniref:enhancer of rudimentary n=1 Tax=Halteromyces radiatus TaxID=101107 RepID=UPI00221FF914|nr:enhancer of rudimentary [Halteromyces radiatus]KAI8098993.1 enhancer of rudimentary [Halteromyces radiatus]